MKTISRICVICNKTFEIPRWRIKHIPAICCSIKCQGKWQSKNRIGEKSANWKGGKIEKICKICGKKFYRELNQIKYSSCLYCSFKCRDLDYTQRFKLERNPAWCGGLSVKKYNKDFYMTRLLILKRDNYTCQECKKSKNQLTQPLHVHHIDYDKKNDFKSNLITLCRSCHSKTNMDRLDWTLHFLSMR